MKKLLLLDADVIIDLYTLSLFEKTSKAYDIYITKEVFDEADHFKKDGVKKGINIDGVVKSPIYCVAAIFQALDIPYVLSRT